MKNKNNITEEALTSFFKNIKKEGELDESTFTMWKSELQKDLPYFWESITKRHR